MRPELLSLSELDRGPDSPSGVVGTVLSSRSSWVGVRRVLPPYLPNYDESKSDTRIGYADQDLDRLSPSHLITGTGKPNRGSEQIPYPVQLPASEFVQLSDG